jgi:hypothetical protein
VRRDLVAKREGDPVSRKMGNWSWKNGLRGVKSPWMTTALITRASSWTRVRRGLAYFALFFSPGALYAQGCAMCYQSAAASGARFATALRHGILIMFFPPLMIFAGILLAAYRRRDQFNGDKRAEASDYDLDLDQAF